MDFAPGVLLALALTGYFLGAAGALALWKRPQAARWWSFGGAFLAAACGLGAAVAALAQGAGGSSWRVELPRLMAFIPMAFPMTLRLDALGAFFLLVVSLLGVALSLYSLGYARGILRAQERRRAGRVLQPAAAGDDAGVRGGQRVFFSHRLGNHGADGLLAWSVSSMKRRKRAAPACCFSSCRTSARAV